jgi:hypothetical protein
MIKTVQYSTYLINQFKKFSIPAFHSGFSLLMCSAVYVFTFLLPLYNVHIQYVCVTAGTLARCPVGAIPANQRLIGSLDLYLKGLSHEIDFKNFDKNLQNLS